MFDFMLQNEKEYESYLAPLLLVYCMMTVWRCALSSGLMTSSTHGSRRMWREARLNLAPASSAAPASAQPPARQSAVVLGRMVARYTGARAEYSRGQDTEPGGLRCRLQQGVFHHGGIENSL